MTTGTRKIIGADQRIELEEVAVILGVSKRTLLRTIDDVRNRRDLSRRKSAVVRVAEIFFNCPTGEDVKAWQVFQAAGGQLVQGEIIKSLIDIEEFSPPESKIFTDHVSDSKAGFEDSPNATSNSLNSLFGNWVAPNAEKPVQSKTSQQSSLADQEKEKRKAVLTADLKKIVSDSRKKGGNTPLKAIYKILKGLYKLGEECIPHGVLLNESYLAHAVRAASQFVSFGHFLSHGKPADTWLFIESVADHSLVELLSVTQADIEGGRLVELSLVQWSQYFIKTISQKKADAEAQQLEDELTKYETQLKKNPPSKVQIPKNRPP